MIKCGIDIGGTGIKFGIFNDLELVKEFSIPTTKKLEEFCQNIANAIKENYDYKKIEKYIIAIPGAIKDDVVIYAPNTNIVGLNLRKELKALLGEATYIIENDANLAALAEARLTNTKNLVLLTLGTGLGGGIVINNEIYNMNGFAGEVGHIKVNFSKDARQCGCSKRGCAETYVSAGGLVYDYNRRHNTKISAKDFFTKVDAKEEDAIEDLKSYARYLGLVISQITQVLAIDDVRFAGGVSLAADYFLDDVIKAYKEYSIIPLANIKISQAKLKNEAGIYSAKYL